MPIMARAHHDDKVHLREILVKESYKAQVLFPSPECRLQLGMREGIKSEVRGCRLSDAFGTWPEEDSEAFGTYASDVRQEPF